VLWLHFEHEVAGFSIGVVWVEDTRVGLEATAGLVPTTCIEGVKIIAPVESEFVRISVIVVHLNVVVENIPRHVSCIEIVPPGIKCGRPEVHSEGLGLVHVTDGGFMVLHAVAHFMAIDLPAHVVGGPLHLVGVPVVLWVKPVGVLV